MTPASTARPHHAAALYDSDEDLRGRVLAFLRSGLRGGEAVLAIVSQRAEKNVAAALGDEAAGIRWSLPGVSYQHLGRASEAIRGYLAGRRAAGAPTRLLTEGEVDVSGRGRMAAYLRSEMAATRLHGGYGFRWVCLYDRRRYSPEVLAGVAQVHPQMVGADGITTGNATYAEPATYLSAHPGPVSVIPARVSLDLSLTEIGDLVVARHRVSDVAQVLGLTAADSRVVEVAAGERRSTAQLWLTKLGLGGHENDYPHALSGGMRQRVSIARAFATNANILLCDEPFSALDESTAGRLRAEFVRLVKENGKTAVFITHSISEALEIGDRIVVLKRPAKIAYDVSFDAGTGQEERELIRSRIGDVLAA